MFGSDSVFRSKELHVSGVGMEILKSLNCREASWSQRNRWQQHLAADKQSDGEETDEAVFDG